MCSLIETNLITWQFLLCMIAWPFSWLNFWSFYYCFNCLGTDEAGYIITKPDSSITVTAILANNGSGDTFKLSIDTAAGGDNSLFDYTINPETTQVSFGSRKEIKVMITFPPNTPVGFSTTLILVAQSIHDIDINDYVTFDITAFHNCVVRCFHHYDCTSKSSFFFRML